MAEPGELFTEAAAGEGGDISMVTEAVAVEIDPTLQSLADLTNSTENGLPFEDQDMEEVPQRVRYIDYLKSPAVGLLVGQGDEQGLLTAHQALLMKSPWFKEQCERFGDDVGVSKDPHYQWLRTGAHIAAKNRNAQLPSWTRISMP